MAPRERDRERDVVDRIVEQWGEVRAELDVSPLQVIGRVSRLSRLVDRRLAENFARFGIEAWMYDVLATLRRQGPPFELSAGELVQQAMVTTGAITNRIDRLEARGYVARVAADDRRKVIVRLTASGLELVDRVAPSHVALERELLASLGSRQERELVAHLRTLLVDLGDLPV